jgi:quinol monooxygenase YgiN
LAIRRQLGFTPLCIVVHLEERKEVSVAFAVVTTVKVNPESIDRLAALFDETNRDLVAGHADWLGAWFTADRERGEVTVIARWHDPSSYQALRESPEFQSTMARFAEDFVEPPRVSINEILVEM